MKPEAPFLRTEFNYDREKASRDSALVCLEPSLAVQDALEETDINTIVRRFGLTGQLPSDVRAPQYGDFTGITDYREALDALVAADRAFMELPANVRARFENDAAQFVDFCSDPKNYEEARKLGLLVPEAPKAPPVEVRVISDPVPSGGAAPGGSPAPK